MRDAQETVLALLSQIAPDVDLGSVDPNKDLRREIDLDSLDFQTLVEKVAQATGVQIPEIDYSQVRSLRGMSDYISARSG